MSWPGRVQIAVWRIEDADAPWWQWTGFENRAPGAYVSAAGWWYPRRATTRQRPFIMHRQVRDRWNNPWTTGNGGSAFRVTEWTLGLPHWFLIALAALPPAWWTRGAFFRRLARVRNIAGLCPQCGYDLRATPGRCPECGAGRKTSN